jgi:hypothetical protein
MNFKKLLRILMWCAIIIIASVGVPIAGALPMTMKKDDEPPVKIELVLETEEEEQDIDHHF